MIERMHPLLAGVLLAWALTSHEGSIAQTTGPATGLTISGRVTDPPGPRPEDAELRLVRQNDGGSFSLIPVPLRPDGTFVTGRLASGTHVLQVIRTPNSPTKPATLVGLEIVRLGASSVKDVVVAIERDTALTGRFRMESDNPAATWPPQIVVNAWLALDGEPLYSPVLADGATGGRFVLRNAFGPRVLRSGYTVAPGSHWWEWRVLLDGVDITNVPTDFSTKQHSKLELVFTQHPAFISGTITDPQGQPVKEAWVALLSADRELWQPWASTTKTAKADWKGQFRVSVFPGRYLVRALPPIPWGLNRPVLKDLDRLASGATVVGIKERESKTISLTVDGSTGRR